ncbi:hypothetical protein ANTRET_LOCUS278 [Anthophora retusa]
MHTTVSHKLPGKFYSVKRVCLRQLYNRPGIGPHGILFLSCWDKVGESIWGNACLVRRASSQPVIAIRSAIASWTNPPRFLTEGSTWCAMWHINEKRVDKGRRIQVAVLVFQGGLYRRKTYSCLSEEHGSAYHAA